MRKAFKYRLYPTDEQKEKIHKFIGCSRFIYNKCLDKYNEAYKIWKENGKQDEFNDLKVVTSLFDEFPWLKECDSVALRTSKLHFESALNAFFKSKKSQRKGKKAGFPKHKSRHKSKRSYSTYNNSNCIRIHGNNVKLPKLGWVSMKYHRPLSGTIKTVTVTWNRSDKYYVTFLCDCPNEIPLLVNKKNNIKTGLKVVGLDMSMSRFVVSSNAEDDTIAKYIKQYRIEEQRLARLDRNVSRKKLKKGTETKKYTRSKNRDKACIRYAVASEKISNRRKDFCWKIAAYFARKYDVIVLESINMQEMSRTLKLGKSVMDLGFGFFRNCLGHECEKYDCTIVYADKWFPSSKLCHDCGHKNTELKLSDREWVCPNCSAVIDRDRNAALNLRDYFFEKYNTAGTAEIYASGDETSTLREILGRALLLKEEAHSFRDG